MAYSSVSLSAHLIFMFTNQTVSNVLINAQFVILMDAGNAVQDITAA